MSIYLIHNSVLQYTDIGFDWEIGRGKKRKELCHKLLYTVSRHASQISK